MIAPVIVGLDAAAAAERTSELAEVLVDAVAGGASVGFMSPYGHDAASAYWQSLLPQLADGSLIMLGALIDGVLRGTVQLDLATMPNQIHRADVRKLLVHRGVRRRGLGRLLMREIEGRAMAAGRSLLTLDTIADSEAVHLYTALGWTQVGDIPDYARMPDGPLRATRTFYKRLAAIG